MSDPQVFDVVVIGAGPGGVSAATTAAGLGKSVAIVEKHPARRRGRPEHRHHPEQDPPRDRPGPVWPAHPRPARRGPVVAPRVHGGRPAHPRAGRAATIRAQWNRLLDRVRGDAVHRGRPVRGRAHGGRRRPGRARPPTAGREGRRRHRVEPGPPAGSSRSNTPGPRLRRAALHHVDAAVAGRGRGRGDRQRVRLHVRRPRACRSTSSTAATACCRSSTPTCRAR